MKQLLYLTTFLFLLNINVFPQQTKFPTLWKGFISLGYGNTTAGNINQYYDLIINSYNNSGVPIKKQTEFGRTLILNGGFLFTRIERIWFGLSVEYLYSPSYSGYKDFLGSLKVNGYVNSFGISIKVKTTVANIGEFPLNISIQPGMDYVTTEIIQELRYLDFTKKNYDMQ